MGGGVSREGFVEEEGFDVALKDDAFTKQPSDGGRLTLECGDWQPEGFWVWEQRTAGLAGGGWLRSGLTQEGQLNSA